MSNGDKPRAAIHVGAPAKSFSAAEGNEPERRGWDEKTYRLKNQDTNNHYDFTRKHLNFEVNSKGEIVPLGSNPVPLHERLSARLAQLGFKPYRGKANPMGNSYNSPNCTVGIIVSGDHDVLTRLAFGDQEVDFSLQKSNAHVKSSQGIKDWAMDTYQWACRRWGAENIIGFDVHLDETTPHIHIQTVPVAMTKTRGRVPARYLCKQDTSISITHQEWKKLTKEKQGEYLKIDGEKEEKESVSFALVWGANRHEVRRTLFGMHTDYHNEVGRKYGLERGDIISLLPESDKRKRVHKNKAVLEAEHQAEVAISKTKAEKKALEQEKDRIAAEARQLEQRRSKAENGLDALEAYAKAADIKQEELVVPDLQTDPLVIEAHKAIQTELDKPIPSFGQKQWRADRKKAVKLILTNMQTALLKAKETQKQDILNLGRALYKKAMKDIAAIIEQNKQLMKANKALMAENKSLKTQISSMDKNAIKSLLKQKDDEIRRIQEEREKADSRASQASKMVADERRRADRAEGQVREMLGVPEIKEKWDAIQHNKKVSWQQMERWINEAVRAIEGFAMDHRGLFSRNEEQTISMGIIAQAFKDGLDVKDMGQRKQAANNLLSQVSWTGTTDYKSGLSSLRTRQLCEEMVVPESLIQSIILAIGGRGPVPSSGGGSDNELTNWDGTKKRNGWGR